MNFKEYMEARINEAQAELNEVKFSEKNLQKVVKLYSSIMGKQMSGKFMPIGMEEYKRKMGAGKGFRVMNNAGEQLRFNWDQKLAKKAMFDLTSIDYWAKGNIDFQKPTRTVTFGAELNVLQVLSKITDALKTGTINEATEIIEEANGLLLEKRTSAEKKEWLEANGMPKSLAGSEKGMRKRAEELGLSEQLEVFLGEPETNTFAEKLDKVDKKMNDKNVYADPDLVFQDIEDLTGLVASGKWRTLIVCGMGGVGKTYHITSKLDDVLGTRGTDYMYHAGASASPSSFYRTLFQERDKVIVFDEADSFLKNDEIIMMLKPILDTSGDNMAEYLKGTQSMTGQDKNAILEYSAEVDEKIADGKIPGQKGKGGVLLPSKFYFTGGMIFISNMPASKIEQAIMSRSIFVDVHLAEQDVLKRIQTILRLGITEDAGAADSYTAEDVELVMEALGGTQEVATEKVTYMTPEYARGSKKMTVRAGKLGLTMLKSGLSNWARLAALYA